LLFHAKPQSRQVAKKKKMKMPSLLCFVAVLIVGSFVRADEQKPPNVLLILADDIAWTDYGFMGHKTIHTPNLDRLARESLIYTRGYVPSSLCRPSLMSLITGQYPHQHLVTGNDPPKGTPRETMLKHIDRCPTIPKLLAKQGYACLQTGKWWEGSYERGGFTHGMTHGDPARGGRHGDEGLKIGRQGLKPITDFLDSLEYRLQAEDDRLKPGLQPFFIWYAPMLPHQPHNPPERLLEKYAGQTDSLHVAKYWAMVEWFDETCGELLGELKKRGLEENTLVVYLADNGWGQDPIKPTFDARSKRSRFDGGLRTPIMLRQPGKIKPRRDESTLASSIDLAPTILAACGAKATDEMPGINLLAGRAGEGKGTRDTIFGAVFEHDIPDIDRAAPGLQHRWCIQRQWKLIVPARERDDIELFDVLADPHEAKNLAEQHPDVVAQLRTKLDAWWTP